MAVNTTPPVKCGEFDTQAAMCGLWHHPARGWLGGRGLPQLATPCNP